MKKKNKPSKNPLARILILIPIVCGILCFSVALLDSVFNIKGTYYNYSEDERLAICATLFLSETSDFCTGSTPSDRALRSVLLADYPVNLTSYSDVVNRFNGRLTHNVGVCIGYTNYHGLCPLPTACTGEYSCKIRLPSVLIYVIFSEAGHVTDYIVAGKSLN